MKRLALFAVAILSVTAFAQKKSAAQVAVEKQIAKQGQAYMHKDVAGVTSVFTADYKSVNSAGQSADVKKLTTVLGALFKAANSIKVSSTIVSFKMEKGNAHVVRKNTFDAQMRDPQGKLGKFHSDAKVDEIWVPAGGTFKLKFTKGLSASRTFNGVKIGK